MTARWKNGQREHQKILETDLACLVDDLRSVWQYAPHSTMDGPAIGFALMTCWWAHIAWRGEKQTERTHLKTLRTLARGAY